MWPLKDKALFFARQVNDRILRSSIFFALQVLDRILRKDSIWITYLRFFAELSSY